MLKKREVGATARRLVTIGEIGEDSVECGAAELARQVRSLIDDHGIAPSEIRIWKPAQITVTGQERKVVYVLEGPDMYEEIDDGR